MKRIYALIACVAAAGCMAASAQAEAGFKEAGLSRGTTPEEIIEECDVLVYYDYFFNWYDYPAGTNDEVLRDSWRGLRSAQYKALCESGDAYKIVNVLSDIIPVHVSADGEYYITAGESTDNGSIVVTQFEKKEDGTIYDNVSDYVTYFEGNFPLTFYQNAIAFEDENGVGYGLGIYNQEYGITELVTDLFWIQSNATISYDAQYDIYDEVWRDPYPQQRVHVTSYETYPEDEEANHYIIISSILPSGNGTEVRADLIDGKAYFIDQIVHRPYWAGSYGYTGDLIMTEWDLAGDGTIEYGSSTLEANFEEEWTANNRCYSFTLTYEGNWGSLSGLGSSLYMAKGLTLTLDDVWMTGVNSIVNDNRNADPVYYNLQGMRVANPKAGQIYIVKQGDKTTKQIYR